MTYYKPGQLSQHFWRKEFACKCGCGFDTVDAELISALETLRWELGEHAVVVNSGCRCEAYNKLIGGSSDSQHLLGKAADIYVRNIPNADVQALAEIRFRARYGIGKYDRFTHIDVRSGHARWDLRS